jgi:SAM-dependent methyltransferase
MVIWLRKFFRWNQDICVKIEGRLPAAFRRHLFTSYKYLVADKIDSTGKGLTVIDIGGGKECPYYQFTKSAADQNIIAVDIDESEIRQNPNCRDKVVCDAATKNLPFADASVDMITSRSVMEHLHDNEAFLSNCHKALRDGGYLINTFPCRWAPFAIINKLLPDRLARLLLYYFHPEWRDACGFKVFYNHCSYGEMRALLEARNFDVVHYELRYYQAIYYDFFVPLYLLMLAYDLLIWLANAKGLCCQMLFVARKRTA